MWFIYLFIQLKCRSLPDHIRKIPQFDGLWLKCITQWIIPLGWVTFLTLHQYHPYVSTRSASFTHTLRSRCVSNTTFTKSCSHKTNAHISSTVCEKGKKRGYHLNVLSTAGNTAATVVGKWDATLGLPRVTQCSKTTGVDCDFMRRCNLNRARWPSLAWRGNQ